MKCKNCGGNLDLNIKEGKLYCSHCNSIFNIDDIKESNVTFNECKYCGAIILANEDISLKQCLYCGGKSLIVKSDSFDPKNVSVVPFQYTVEQFRETVTEHLKKIVDGRFLHKYEKTPITKVYYPYSKSKLFFGKDNFEEYREYMLPKKRVLLDTYYLYKIAPFKIYDAKPFNSAYFDVANGVLPRNYKEIIVDKNEIYSFVPVYQIALKDRKNKLVLFMNGETGEISGMYQKNVEKFRFVDTTIKEILILVLWFTLDSHFPDLSLLWLLIEAVGFFGLLLLYVNEEKNIKVIDINIKCEE